MSAGLRPANSFNHLNRDSGIPFDSIRSAHALAMSSVPATWPHKAFGANRGHDINNPETVRWGSPAAARARRESGKACKASIRGRDRSSARSAAWCSRPACSARRSAPISNSGNWDYQKRADKIEKDAAGALTALEGLNAIVDDKFLTPYALDDAIKSRADSAKLDPTIVAFTAADKAWERQHQSLALTLEIVIDSQFGIDDLAATALAKKVDGTRYLFNGLQANGSKPLPVCAVLETLYTCQTQLKQSIEAQVRARDENGNAWPAKAAEPDPGRIVLGHLWRAQNVVQCLMIQRAVEIRGQAFGVSFLPFGKADGSAPCGMSETDRAREGRCIAPYRDDPTFGTALLKHPDVTSKSRL